MAVRIITCETHLQAKYPRVFCPLKYGSAVSPCDLGCLEQNDQSAQLKGQGPAGGSLDRGPVPPQTLRAPPAPGTGRMCHKHVSAGQGGPGSMMEPGHWALLDLREGKEDAAKAWRFLLASTVDEHVTTASVLLNTDSVPHCTTSFTYEPTCNPHHKSSSLTWKLRLREVQ